MNHVTQPKKSILGQKCGYINHRDHTYRSNPPHMFRESASAIQGYFANSLHSIYTVVTIHSNEYQQEVDIFRTKDGHDYLCRLKAAWNHYAPLQYTVSGRMMDKSPMDMEAAC